MYNGYCYRIGADCSGPRPLFPQWSRHVYPQFLPNSHPNAPVLKNSDFADKLTDASSRSNDGQQEENSKTIRYPVLPRQGILH